MLRYHVMTHVMTWRLKNRTVSAYRGRLRDRGKVLLHATKTRHDRPDHQGPDRNIALHAGLRKEHHIIPSRVTSTHAVLWQKCLHFSMCACHYCAGAMLIFSVLPILTDDPRRESNSCHARMFHWVALRYVTHTSSLEMKERKRPRSSPLPWKAMTSGVSVSMIMIMVVVCLLITITITISVSIIVMSMIITIIIFIIIIISSSSSSSSSSCCCISIISSIIGVLFVFVLLLSLW